MVLEAWSDERTFYRWNDDGSFPDPESLVQGIRAAGLHLVIVADSDHQARVEGATRAVPRRRQPGGD